MPQQTQNDLVQTFNELVQALELSSTAFDQGYEGEAKRLAVSIRVLVHDTERSTSLLGQLSRKALGYYTTPHRAVPGNLYKGSFLFRERVGCDADGRGYLRYMPRLDNLPPGYVWTALPFSDWWDEVVLWDANNEFFTRKHLVLTLANKDGGAHVDPDLETRYANLSRNNSIGWVVITDQGNKAPDNAPERVCARQIAFELLKTLREQLPDLIGYASDNGTGCST